MPNTDTPTDDTPELTALVSMIPEVSGSKAFESLEPNTQVVLEAFQVWLKTAEPEGDGKSEATAAAYKGYVAKAIVSFREGKTWKDLSTDVRSGIRAFNRYTETLKQADEDVDNGHGKD